jgi:hypothetical protein
LGMEVKSSEICTMVFIVSRDLRPPTYTDQSNDDNRGSFGLRC